MTDDLARLLPRLGRARRAPHLRRRDRPIVWAHRGVSAHATENTLPAFALAAAHGADGIELDVMPCASGELVVFHDDDLRRLAGRPEAIADLDLAAVRAVELIGGGRIPTLAEAIEAAGDLLLNVELKVVHPGRPGVLPTAAARLLGDLPWLDRLVVSSFDPIALWQFHVAAPQVALGCLFEEAVPAPWHALGPLLGASSLHVLHALASPAAIAGWRAQDFAVHAWTVDDPARLRALAAAGIDGVFANDPRAARAALTA